MLDKKVLSKKIQEKLEGVNADNTWDAVAEAIVETLKGTVEVDKDFFPHTHAQEKDLKLESLDVKKLTGVNISGVNISGVDIPSLSDIPTVDKDADRLLIYDASLAANRKVSPTALGLGGSASNPTTFTVTAGEALTKGQPVYIGTDSKAYKASKQDVSKVDVVGLAVAEYSQNATATIQQSGVLENTNWALSPGETVLLGNNGSLTQDITEVFPNLGEPVVVIGTAISSTKLNIATEAPVTIDEEDYAAIGNWTPFTMTIGATVTAPTKGTIVNDKAQWRRVGECSEISYSYKQSTVGTAGSGLYLFPLPPGQQIDLTKHPVDSCVGYGVWSSVADEVSTSTQPMYVYVRDANNLYLKYGSNSGGYVTPTLGVVASSTISLAYSANLSFRFNCSVAISGWTSNINLISDFTEYAFNTQATINTNDTTSFGYGPQGTPILANTASTSYTSYTVKFSKPFSSSDWPVLQFRHKATGIWMDVDKAFYFNGTIPFGFTLPSKHYEVNTPTGAVFIPATQDTVKVIFYGIAVNMNGQNYTWATVTSDATYGYDRWRLRKVSNGNMAEYQPAPVEINGYRNYIGNGGFEAGVAGWTVVGTGLTMTQTTT